MAINEKRPPIKQTVGAQYVCFAKPSEDGKFTAEYEEAVEKSEVVKSVKVSEQAESSKVMASGKVYQTSNQSSGTEISTEVVAFPADTLAQMRAETVCKNGLVKSGGGTMRPFFAYGKVVVLDAGNYRYEWYPKCQLTANTDDINTQEEKFSEQNDTITILAYPFDDEGNINTKVDSTIKIPEGLSEDKFFAKPILTETDLDAAAGVTPASDAKSGAK